MYPYSTLLSLIKLCYHKFMIFHTLQGRLRLMCVTTIWAETAV